MSTVAINGFEIHGTVLKAWGEPPALPVSRAHFWGLAGESELRSLPAGRPIAVRMVIHNAYASFDALQLDLAAIESRVREHGILEISGDDTLFRVFEHCTFHGFVPERHQAAGPLPDVGGTLDGGWWIQGTLHFYQLKVPL